MGYYKKVTNHAFRDRASSFLINSDNAKFSAFMSPHVLLPQKIERETRYQIDVKGNSGKYLLQVSELEIISSNMDTEEEYKYFSAFARTDEGISFCLMSLSNDVIDLEVEFYHGFYDKFEADKGANEFLDMTRRMQEMTKLIDLNYEKYQRQLIEREPVNTRIQWISSFAIVLFLLTIAVVKVIYLSRVTKYMKARKII